MNKENNEELNKIINEAVIQGIVGSCALFLKCRNIEYTDESLVKFAGLVSIEYGIGRNPADGYFLPDSLASVITSSLETSIEHLLPLRNPEDNDAVFRKCIRVVASGETINLLDKHAAEAINAFKSM